jgi:glyoxylase-like metal-dependent hydrolase (beta-lactamase superfamily II)
MRRTTGLALASFLLIAPWNFAAAARDDGVPVNAAQYAGRALAANFTAGPCPNTPRGLEQIKGNLYRHTAGAGLAVHSGLVLVTKEGALVIDPAMTCTASWLRDEIKRRFDVSVAYVVLTHAHADHISGAQVFQKDGAVVVANQRAIEPIVGERIPTALPDRIFDKEMIITLGGETIRLVRVAPSHSDSMTMVLFPD